MIAWLKKLFAAAPASPSLDQPTKAPPSSAVFLVQRAGTGAHPNWCTLCSSASEEYAREVYHKQLSLSSTGQFRLLDPAGKVLIEAKAQPFFERKVFEGYGPSAYYVPEKPGPPRKH
jgi:hypothetical protein